MKCMLKGHDGLGLRLGDAHLLRLAHLQALQQTSKHLQVMHACQDRFGKSCEGTGFKRGEGVGDEAVRGYPSLCSCHVPSWRGEEQNESLFQRQQRK